MANRPNPCCNLDKSKHISQQDGFCDTFNWLVACMTNIKGDDKTVQVTWEASDTPVIELVDNENNGEGGDEGGSGEVTFTGTDDSVSDPSSEFVFESADDSNVEVKMDGNIITIGVYYK